MHLGFCKTAEAEKELIDFGVLPINVWMVGRGAESLDEVIKRNRGEPGDLYVAEDLRVIGKTQADIFTGVKQLNKARITVHDINNPEATIEDLMQLAFKAMHSACAIRNHRTARRRGRQGGLAKAANAAARRRAEVSDEIARALWASRLTKKEKAAILRITISTGDRHYGVHAT